MSTNKYYLEIDASGFEAPCDEGRWLGYGLIVTEGNTLGECLDNAQVDRIDQDGGEHSIRPVESDAMLDAIEKAFMDKYEPGETEDQAADRLEREEREYQTERRAEADERSADVAALNKESGRG